MKYYSYGDVVMPFQDGTHYKHIVSHMRFILDNDSIMIEDIEECSQDDYIAYLEEWIRKADDDIKNLKKVMSTNYSSIDVEGLYGESYDRSLPY